MLKAVVLVLADTETHGDIASVVNTLDAGKELSESCVNKEWLISKAIKIWRKVDGKFQRIK